jgi:O-antigen ligase
VFTLSRAAWLALVLGGLVIVALAAGRVRRLALAAVAVAVAAMLLHPGVQARLRHLTVQGDNADRVEIWNVCRAVIADHPWTGVGWANLPRRAAPYYDRLQRVGEMRAWCHDSLLSAWAEGGPILFVAMLAYWVLLARAFWRGARTSEPLRRAAATGGLAAVAAMALNALVHDVFYSSEAMYGFGFAIAIAAVLARLNAPAGAEP